MHQGGVYLFDVTRESVQLGPNKVGFHFENQQTTINSGLKTRPWVNQPIGVECWSNVGVVMVPSVNLRSTHSRRLNQVARFSSFIESARPRFLTPSVPVPLATNGGHSGLPWALQRRCCLPCHCSRNYARFNLASESPTHSSHIHSLTEPSYSHTCTN